MVLGNPVLDSTVKLVRLDQDLLRFSLRSYVGEGVVDGISLPATGLKIIGVLVSRLPQYELYAFKRYAVMSDLAYDTISCTRDRHVRGLECSIVGSCETPVCRKARKVRVCQVAGDQGSHIVQFLLGCFVFLGTFICQQFRPSHSDLLLQTASGPARP